MSALRPDQQQFLDDIRAWNEYARRLNAKAIEQGVVSAETVRRDRERSEAARADLLARWGN